MLSRTKLGVYNTINTLSSIYYPITHLFIIKSIKIVGALVPCIELMQSKWLEYYKSIPIIYLLELVFDSRRKLDNLSDYLQVYYKCLNLVVNVPALIKKY